MTKRLTAALLCVAASFAIGGVATAQAKSLPYKTAKTLAKRLAEKQVKGRDVVSFHLLLPRRVGDSRIVFQYDDRTTANVFCTALVVVDQRVSGRVTKIGARFTAQDCHGIPSEVLKFEAITRTAQRELRANTAPTVEAVDAVKASARRCRAVKVPRSKRDEASALFDIALVEALERPNAAAVGRFAAGLLAVKAKNATLAAAALAWADYAATVTALPDVTDPCGLVKAWGKAGFAADKAPIDFAAYRALDRRAAVDRQAIRRGARLLAKDGVFPNAVVGFTPSGLLEHLVVSVGITGGKEKVVLG
jgi:hypothetical protein